MKFQIQNSLKQAVLKGFGEVEIEEIEIEYPNDPSHGDYSTNIAMKLGKILGKNPREVAQIIVDNWEENELIQPPEIAGPGFINFTVKTQWLTKELKDILARGEDYGKSHAGKGEIVIIDMSAPNIAKPMNVGHLRSTIIGDSIKRLYKTIGFNAIGDNHIGDWGTQFGKLIYAFKNWGDKKAVEKNPIPELLTLYVRFHDEAEKDEQLDENARKEFAKLEKGDTENRELWKWFVEESLKEFDKIYKKLGVEIEETWGESFYENMLPDVLEELKLKKIAQKNEDGSLAVVFENFGIDLPSCLVQKKDGSTLYMTRDLAKIKFITEKFNAKKSIYVVGNEQNLNFKQLFKIAELLGYNLDLAHVGFGLVRLKEGKLSTRKGRVIYLEEVIFEAEDRVRAILKERKVNFDKEETENLVRIMSIGAIKYNDLSQNRMTEIMFDWDKMLSFEGNSAPYIQYTYARSRSILRKAGEFSKDFENKFTDEKELILLRLLAKYPEYVLESAEEYKPNIIANYIFALTQEFNNFYNNVSVLNAEDKKIKNMRLALVEAVTIVIKSGMDLLGIEVPERM